MVHRCSLRIVLASQDYVVWASPSSFVVVCLVLSVSAFEKIMVIARCRAAKRMPQTVLLCLLCSS
jgi:hypothetical protein